MEQKGVPKANLLLHPDEPLLDIFKFQGRKHLTCRCRAQAYSHTLLTKMGMGQQRRDHASPAQSATTCAAAQHMAVQRLL